MAGRSGRRRAAKLDLAAMMKHKDDTVAANVNASPSCSRRTRSTGCRRGEDCGVRPLVVAAPTAPNDHEPKAIVIATGSDVAKLPGIEIDERQIIPRPARVAGQAPKSLIVVGRVLPRFGSVWPLGAR